MLLCLLACYCISFVVSSLASCARMPRNVNYYFMKVCVSLPKKIILSCHQLELGTWIKIWVMWLRYLDLATYLWPDNYRPDITEIRLKRTKTRESRNCCHIIITPYDRICPSYGRNTTPRDFYPCRTVRHYLVYVDECPCNAHKVLAVPVYRWPNSDSESDSIAPHRVLRFQTRPPPNNSPPHHTAISDQEGSDVVKTWVS